jgi:alpha-1,6-mannosyltransferase
MHIADITMFYAPESGGTKRYLLAKRNWLAQRPAFRHTLLVPGASAAAAPPGTAWLRSVPLPGAGRYRLPLGAAQGARLLRSIQPDVIEAGDPYLCALSALSAARDLDVPAVAFAHCDLEHLIERTAGRLVGGAVRSWLRRLYARFDLVLAASSTVERRLRAAGLANVARQPLGVDTRLFHPQQRDPDFRQRLGLPNEARLLVYAGRFAGEKNLGVLERALHMLGRPYVLVSVGSGPRPARGAGVRALPYLQDPRDVARVLASCDAFVHPGDQETFGLIVVEAMACGLPVVGTAAGGVAELVDESVGIKVEPRNARALAEGIAALFQRDPAALGRNGRARAVARHDWDAVMPGLVAHYRAALARYPAARHATNPVGEIS